MDSLQGDSSAGEDDYDDPLINSTLNESSIVPNIDPPVPDLQVPPLEMPIIHVPPVNMPTVPLDPQPDLQVPPPEILTTPPDTPSGSKHGTLSGTQVHAPPNAVICNPPNVQSSPLDTIGSRHSARERKQPVWMDDSWEYPSCVTDMPNSNT
jgi:hypothetical protein